MYLNYGASVKTTNTVDKVPGIVSAHNKSLKNINGIFANILYTKQPTQYSIKWEASFNIII